jgi:methylglyoxal synthase
MRDDTTPAPAIVAVLWNIPVACNRATADFLISSPLMNCHAVGDRPGF